MDRNGDGSISISELQALSRMIGRGADPEREAREIISSIGGEGAERVTIDAFLAFAPRGDTFATILQRLVDDDEMIENFYQLSIQKSKLAGLPAFFDEVRGAKDSARRVAETMDRNGDGSISISELQALSRMIGRGADPEREAREIISSIGGEGAEKVTIDAFLAFETPRGDTFAMILQQFVDDDEMLEKVYQLSVPSDADDQPSSPATEPRANADDGDDDDEEAFLNDFKLAVDKDGDPTLPTSQLRPLSTAPIRQLPCPPSYNSPPPRPFDRGTLLP